MNEVLAVLIAVVGGLAGGLVGVGGGVLFVPALAIFLGLSQVEAESTSLMMIVIVAVGRRLPAVRLRQPQHLATPSGSASSRRSGC